MKKLFFLLIVSSFFTACSVQNIGLKGHYLDTPFEITTDKPIDSVWSNIIDLFAQKGLSIKVIDKNSGLITTEKTSFLSNYSMEKADGTLENPNAWVVITKQTYGGSALSPQTLTGEWNVRVKAVGEHQTKINVNITNIQGGAFYPGGAYSPPINATYEGKSTGKFEQIIADYVK